MLNGQKISGEPAELVTRALQLDPKNLKALALAGGAAYEAGQYPQAIEYWTLARQLSPADTPFSDNLERSIADARQALQGGGAVGVAGATGAASAPSTQASTTASASGPAQVSGQVSLAPALAGKVSPSDTVFIFARAAEGPRMPLAILRRTVADLPFSFTLDDSLAMSPAMKLSKFPVVVVGARISKTGNALPSPGDLSGQASGVKTGTSGLQIVIDTVQP
jgi:cytochrome c-type biogenesis protein CcmH